MMKNKKGFTLIELLAVIVVLAIIIGLTVMSITNYIEKSREETMNVIAANIFDSVKKDYSFHEQNKREYYDLLGENSNLLEKNLVNSPWGNKYEKVLVSIKNDKALICIVDEKGKGIVATEDQILNGKISQYTVEECQSIFSERTAANEIIVNKVGTDGLVSITHPADNTLQLGATTPITEYRYQGANPNNYVNFNGEDGDYRIIGVFPTDDGEGNITNRIKLIKTTNYEDNYWNNSTNINKWGEASLKTTLNDTYFNSLTNKELIDNVKYYLGGHNTYTFTNETMYQYERKISGSDYYYTKDGISNPTSWTGPIGLMYASDYMYGSADCNGKVGYNDSNSSLDTRACRTTNWLYLGSNEWTITEFSSFNYYAFLIFSDGRVYSYTVRSYSFAVRPVLYLSSETVIIDGVGTIDDPYVFGAA